MGVAQALSNARSLNMLSCRWDPIVGVTVYARTLDRRDTPFTDEGEASLARRVCDSVLGAASTSTSESLRGGSSTARDALLIRGRCSIVQCAPHFPFTQPIHRVIPRFPRCERVMGATTSSFM